MTDEEGFENETVAALTATAELTFLVIPILATTNFVLGQPFSTVQVLVGSVLLAVPGTVEFVSSERNLSELGRFLAVVAIGWPASGVIAAVLAATTTVTIETARLAFLPVVYLLAYLLVYAGGYDRIKAAVVS